MEIQNFTDMRLKDELLDMIDAKGFTCPTPIQTEAIPWALAGKDIMGQAQTGTGKTAAFALPILNNIVKGKGLQALILCPTRELAVQVTREIAFLGKKLGIDVLAVYGGQPIERQIHALKRKPEIVVGTPGRLLDHLGRKTIFMAEVKFLVLDEADEMLDMGFLPDIEKILEFCPDTRQTFLFSATLDEKVRRLAYKYMQNPKIIAIPALERTVPVIEQKYYMAKPGLKAETLCAVLDSLDLSAGLIFCRTKKSAAELAGMLRNKGYEADCLHGDMTQRERDFVMTSFRKGNIKILTATDIAARGLDIKHVSHVINYDIPEDPESYVHRIGRTGRAGRKGTAITLIEPEQVRQLRVIERYTGKKIMRDNLPLNDDIITKQTLCLEEYVKEKMKETPFPFCADLAEKLVKENPPQDIVKALLSIIWQDFYGGKAAEGSEKGEMVNIELPWGQIHGVDTDAVIRFLLDDAGLSSHEIGEIEIGKEECYIEVPITYVDAVYKVMDNFKMKRDGRKKLKPSPSPFKNVKYAR